MAKKTYRSRLYYGLMVPLYKIVTTLNGYKQGIKHFIQRQNFPNKNLKILDAGCGSGLVAFSLAEKIKDVEVIAFDYSEEMIKTARRIKKAKGYNNVSLFVGDIENINPLRDLDGNQRVLQEEEFDYVFTAGALEHVDLERGVNELVKYLKNEGTLYYIAARDNLRGRLIGKMTGFKPYSREEIMQSFEEVRLSEIKVIPFSDLEKRVAEFMITLSGKKK